MYSVLKIFSSGGFSQGGHLSLHAVYSHKCQVGGVFGIGSFLSGHSSVFDKIPDRNSLKESVQNLDIAEEEETLYICAEYL